MPKQVSVPLDAALLGFVERAAGRESRTVAGQIRHLIVEAMRHADNTTAASEPWPPPLALVSRDNLSEIKARVKDMEAERDELVAAEKKNGLGLLLQIDQSRPAPRFNVLSQPTEISKQATAVKSAGPLTDAKKLQLDFWTAFRSELLKRKIVPNAEAPRPQYWFHVPLGRTNFTLSNVANTADGKIAVRVLIRSEIASIALPQLEAERPAIESEIGEKLEWNPNPDAMDKTIRLQRAADLNDRDKWPEYVSWLVDKVEKFKNAFGPRVKKLNLDQVPPATSLGP
jgi:hypothetical protein